MNVQWFQWAVEREGVHSMRTVADLERAGWRKHRASPRYPGTWLMRRESAP